MNPTINDIVSLFFAALVIGYLWWLACQKEQR